MHKILFPSSALIKPKPFDVLKNFTVPFILFTFKKYFQIFLPNYALNHLNIYKKNASLFKMMHSVNIKKKIVLDKSLGFLKDNI